MHAAARPYVAAGAALAAASLVAVAPIAPRLPVVSMATRLVDAASDSILNVPVNLFDDLVNIPYYEVQALDTLANSEFYTGTWFVVSSTNLWGVDPGDPTHVAAVAQLIAPNPALSGPLAEQMAGLLTSELPVSAACDAASCLPATPTSPITGMTGVDWFLWLSKILTGNEKFPILNDWFQVPLSQLTSGYTFDPNFPGYADPSGPAYAGFGFPGTTTVDTPNGPEYLMPFANSTFTLNLLAPFESFYNSLFATPTGVEIPTLTELVQALQAVLAGAVVDFDPFTAGSPFCPSDCTTLPAALNYPQIVQDISNVMPGNPIINEWLTAYANGTYNGPTEAQIENSINVLQQGFWDFQNPNPPADWNLGGFDLSQLAPYFQTLWTDLGLYHPGQVASGLDPTALSTGLSTLLAGLGPSTLSTDVSTLLAGLDPTALSADLSTLLGNFATTLAPDLAGMLPAELATNLPAFLSTLPADLLSLF